MQGLLSGFDCFLGLPYASVFVAHVTVGNPIVWVTVRPESISFDGLVIFMGGVDVVMRCDIELFSFAHVFASLKRLAHVFIGQFDLREVGVDRTEPGIGYGEIRIEVDSHLVVRNAFCILAMSAFVVSLCVGL